MYHYFGTPPGPDPERLFVDRPMFVAQLDHLRRTGWRALSLDEYLAALDGAPTPRRSYLLTIDDGHESVGRIAAPLLAERGIPSVLFVCPGLLGDHAQWTPPYREERLSPADELRALPGLGMELGVHSWNHTRMVNLDTAVLEQHVQKSREALEAATGVSARAFAYPFGTHDLASRAAVAEAGYDVAFAVAREHGRYAADRVFVQSTDSMFAFRCKLSSGYRLVSRVGGRAWKLRHGVRSTVARVRSAGTGRRR
jgi:peptidoglycan/xylan/chitin deacetylase (PgdA/CDA1 family)